MATIAIRQTAWQNASVRDRTIFRLACAELRIFGDPAKRTVGGVTWLISDDHRITLLDVARLGVVVAGIASNTTYQLPLTEGGSLDEARLRADMVQWASSRIVWPVDLADATNPWQAVLDAQGAPAAIKAFDRVPDSWAE